MLTVTTCPDCDYLISIVIMVDTGNKNFQITLEHISCPEANKTTHKLIYIHVY